MKRNGIDIELIFCAAICMIFIFVTGCAEIRLHSLPDSSTTAKLRVFVLPVSGSLPRGSYAIPHTEFANNLYDVTGRILREKGIYEVVSQADIQKVTGGQEIHEWQWEKDGWQLAKKAGRSLQADYVLILMRGYSVFHYAKVIMINLTTGKQYESFDHTVTMPDKSMQISESRKMFRESFREIFRQAKGDMLVTAVSKGKMVPQKSELTAKEIAQKYKTEKPVVVSGAKLEQKKSDKVDKEPEGIAGLVEKPKDQPIMPYGEADVKQTDKLKEDEKNSSKQRLVVYDLQTTSQLNVVALILSEALREELFVLGRFDLINREDTGQAIQELKLQQSGLINDKQALQIGKWLAANQTITGNLGIVGDSIILQSKRTDLQTMMILSRGSIRIGIGKEEEMLNALPALARRLISQ